MRELQIDDKVIRVRATPLALLFHKQEFDSDMIAGLMAMQKMQADLSAFDSVGLLQMVWAMNKADAPKGFPSFETWLADLGRFDFSDVSVMNAIMEEATDGFFRGATNGAPK